MEPRYTLTYYDRLFGSRNLAWSALVQTLADEMDDYADEVDEAVRTGASLAPARHDHRPAWTNLGAPVPELSDHPDPAEAGAFAATARALAQALRRDAGVEFTS